MTVTNWSTYFGGGITVQDNALDSIEELARNLLTSSSIEIHAQSFCSVADLVGLSGSRDGQCIIVASYYDSLSYLPGNSGAGIFVWKSTLAKSNHNGVTIISPTVPWAGTQTTLTAYHAKTGETDVSGLGCWMRQYSGQLDMYMAGAIGNGSADDTRAMISAEAIATWVYFPTGTFKVTQEPTLNKSYGVGTVMMSGAQIYLHPYIGRVDKVYASVWNPDTTGATTASTKLQAAIDFAQSNSLKVSFQERASYRLSVGLTFKHGMNGSDTIRYHTLVEGNNASLFPNANITALSIVPRCTLADAATGRGVGDVDISDLKINGGNAPTTAKAIVAGLTGYQFDNLEWSRFSGITIQGFTNSNPVVLMTENRHIKFKDFVCRTGAPFKIETVADGSFAGDFVFDGCEFAGNATRRPFDLACGGIGGEIRGIKMIASAIYGSGTRFRASGTGAMIADFWFEGGTQIDGPTAPAGELAIDIDADGTNAKLSGIHFDDTYIVNYTGAAIQMKTTGSGATGYQLIVKGGQIGTITGHAGSGNAVINCDGIESVDIDGATFDQCTATHLINLNDSTNLVVHNNQATRCTATNGITISGTSNKYSTINNVMNVTTVVNDTAGGATKQTANNLAI